MAILIIADHDNQQLKAATRNAVTAAVQLGKLAGELHVLVAGAGCAAVAEQAAQLAGVAKVKLADAPHYADLAAENLAVLVQRLVAESGGNPGGNTGGNPVGNYSHVLAPATTFGKNLAPRVAALLDAAQLSEIVGIVAADTFVRPIYAGNVLATVRSADPVKVITVRGTAFEACGDGGRAAVEAVAAGPDLGVSKLVGREIIKSARPELTAAKVIVSGGRGLGNGENYKALLEPLADKLNAALGASRAAVDAGFVSNDYQVGQTGKIVAPDLYIAVGISGAIQHLAGMKDSKVIVAINKDPEAPIFQVADYALVGDLFQAVPELTAAL
jgi:electron transfer flavoprotein alpha subunit